MSEIKYRLVLTGRLLEGHSHLLVAQGLGKLLRLSKEDAKELIKGEPTRIRKLLDLETAERMRDKIITRGAECRIEQVGEGESVAEKASKEELSLVEEEALPSESSEESEDPLTLSLEAIDELGAETGEEPGRAEYQLPEATATDEKDAAEDPGRFYEAPQVVVPEEEEAAPNPLFSNMRVRVAAGLLLGLVLLAFFWLSGGEDPPPVAAVKEQTPAKSPVDTPRTISNRRLAELAKSVRVWMIQYGAGFDTSLVTLDRLRKDIGIQDQALQDGWGTEMRYQSFDQGFRLLSAGPDREFETDDDLKREIRVN